MTQSLFIESSLVFEKLGGEVTLPEDPNVWPNEITQELFKQCPYLADFEPHVVMDKVDAERGYGFGHVEVANKTELSRSASPEGLEAAGVRQCKIPIIITNRKLQPFDVIVTEDASMLPLTEARLRQAIFRPQNFDITGKSPGDMSLMGQLYPPAGRGAGMGGSGITMDANMGKEGEEKGRDGHTAARSEDQPLLDSEKRWAKNHPEVGDGPIHKPAFYKKASILHAILPTITAEDYNRFYEQILGDPGVMAAYTKNASAVSPALRALGRCNPVDDNKTASALLEGIVPSVVQLVRDGDGYTVKTANSRCWTVRQEHWDRRTAIQSLGEKVVLAADMSGSATLSLDEGAEPEGAPEAPHDLIKDFGLYAVRDDKGRDLVGYVFPNLIDVDGTKLPLALFWNGSQAAVQGEISGSKTGEGVPLVEGHHPEGHGAFYRSDGEEPEATIPLTIRSTLSEGGEGVTLQAETFDGREVSVQVQPNIAEVMAGEEGTMLVPDTMHWLPLDNAEEVVLMSDGETSEKMAHPTRPFATVLIRSGGVDSFSLDGLALDKIASTDRSFLSTDDALFYLVGLGVRPAHASAKLAEALDGARPVAVKIARSLRTAREAYDLATKEATARRASFPDLRVSLVKEAAVIPDPTAVDTVLSLGFINPENTQTFIDYLPELDAAQKKMCELLVASRLGMKEIPASALEKAVRATEQVLDGLKIIAFQEN